MTFKHLVAIISTLLILTTTTSPLRASLAAASVAAAEGETYLLLFKDNSVSSDVAQAIANAGGTFVYSYPEIGVVIARSSSPIFAASLRNDIRIEGVSATSLFATQAAGALVGAAESSLPGNAPASDTDPLSALQWNMRQIHAPEAHAITGGSPMVVVGNIDTGIETTHPDLAANIDFANSVSCLGGVPDQNVAAWSDERGHGTHTAGIIAAASNGVGVVGVAPNVKIATIRAGNADGFFFPEAVVCAFMWAGSHHLDVTNNSYFADPWLFNCRNDAEQRTIWKAEQRAIRYAISQGVTVVAGQGNQNLDLSKQNVDSISPDTSPTPLTREVTNACGVIPVEIPGVIGVTAVGNLLQKSYYSNYGVGVAQVTAPGGDHIFQRTVEAADGGVLSTYLGGGYAFLQGTSMASPHVAGVAALVISQFGRMPPDAVQAIITSTADGLNCPVNPFLSGTSYEATCRGGQGYNGFYGQGQVNALTAVSK